MAELRRLQAERKAALEAAVAETASPAQLAESKEETANLAEPFERRGFEFQPQRSPRMIGRYRRLKEAQEFGASKKEVRMVA